MHKDAAASDLVLLKSIRDGHLVLGDEPHVAIDAAMIGEIELRLLLAWWVGFVIAVVGTDSDDTVVAYRTGGREGGTGGREGGTGGREGETGGREGGTGGWEGDGDGEIASLMLFDLLAIDVDGLLTHNGLKIEGNVTAFALLGQAEVLAVPDNALIVATTTGLSWH